MLWFVAAATKGFLWSVVAAYPMGIGGRLEGKTNNETNEVTVAGRIYNISAEGSELEGYSITKLAGYYTTTEIVYLQKKETISESTQAVKCIGLTGCIQ